METVLITGGTGLVGQQLTYKLLEKGYRVTVMSRKQRQGSQPNLSYAVWDVQQQTIDTNAVCQADYIVHLAGAGVADERWTARRKQEIVDSRTQSSALLVKVLTENTNKVKAVVSASAIGWYGPDPSAHAHGFEEDDAASNDFLGNTCKAWEESIEPVMPLGKRLVKLRTGIVLDRKGGALTEFMKPIRLGIAAVLGNGSQVVSWIHIGDLCNIYLKAIEDDCMHGSYNAVAPYPVTNKQLTLQLASLVKGKFFMPIHVPSFLLKIALGEMSIEVLKSTTVSSHKVKTSGFSFLYPEINGALKQLLDK